MKQFTGLLALALTVGVVQHAQAQAVRTSQFIGFPTGNVGAPGLEGWTGSSGEVTITNGSGSLDGTGLGLVASEGDKAEISAVDGKTTYNLFAATASQFRPGSFTNLYFSFLYRFKNAADVSTDGERIAEITRQNGSSGTNFQILAKNVSGQIQLGIGKLVGTPAYATTNINVGQTVFVVAAQQWVSGTANDIIKLWINPPTNTFGKGEDLVPSPSATTSDGVEDTSNTGPGRFYLCSGANATFDEFRMGTNWADVTVPVGTCVSAGIGTQPTNITVTEGARARFSITANGTSPICQWQVSTNAGATWQDVSGGTGGTTPVYWTRPLSLADNGNRYRCVVSVSCNNSYATSSVATVTVNAATITPTGVVVDDVWADGDRKNMPFGISNSLWFASNDGGSLSTSVGQMTGTPQPNSARLWVGYFVDVTNVPPSPPVHLDVGRAIKATLVFSASGIISSNGGLRFGLFNYADGAVRLTNDWSGTGSTGNGQSVGGYLLTVNYGTTFGEDTPFSILARNNLESGNLMGTLGDFVSVGTGPAGLSNAPAFQDNVPYTLELTVARTGASSVDITTSVTGGGTNWTFTCTDTNLAYYRFDSFAIRPTSLETTANSFTFTQFKVEVVTNAPTAPAPIPLNVALYGTNVVLSWSNPAFSLASSTNVLGPITDKVAGATSPYTNNLPGSYRFFRLVWP